MLLQVDDKKDIWSVKPALTNPKLSFINPIQHVVSPEQNTVSGRSRAAANKSHQYKAVTQMANLS